MAVLGVLLAALGAAGTQTASAKGARVSVTFPESGMPATWIVPAGVHSVRVTLYGANGGSFTGAGFPGGLGGPGAEVSAVVAVQPGATLDVPVGGAGCYDRYANFGPNCGSSFNGGAPSIYDGSGGGATDLSNVSTGLLLVAGGGGGAGQDGACAACQPTPGGNGGNADHAGHAGAPRPGTTTFSGGGGGGAGNTGGAGGLGGMSCAGAPNGAPGAPGTQGQGGVGGTGAGEGTGGGGGGGYIGGGGGGGGGECAGMGAGAGGGGGGSSHIGGPGVSNATIRDNPAVQRAQLGGNGEAIITYTR